MKDMDERYHHPWEFAQRLPGMAIDLRSRAAVYSSVEELLGAAIEQDGDPLVSSNVACWKIPELNGGFSRKIASKPCLITGGYVLRTFKCFPNTKSIYTLERHQERQRYMSQNIKIV